MPDSAPGPKIDVLITDISSYLGASLAATLLAKHIWVYGVGKHHLPVQLLAKKNFTLLDLDLAQPLPSSLPRFDIIFCAQEGPDSSLTPTSPMLRNLLNVCAQGQSKVITLLSARSDPNLIEFLQKREKDLHGAFSFFLIGDLYGEQMNPNEQTGLGSLIAQAAATDKIILKNEGRDIVYPTYIADIVNFLNETIKNPDLEVPNKPAVLTSSDPQTTLDVAYKIQKVAAMGLGRDLGLFFGGGPQIPDLTPTSRLNSQKLPGATDLEEGLAATLHHLTKFTSSTSATPVPAPVDYPLPVQKAVVKDSRLDKIKNLKVPKIEPKLPRKLLQKKAKLFILLPIIAVLLFLSKGVLDVTFAISDLKSAQTSLKDGNFQKAQNKSQSAASRFGKARGKVSVVTLVISPFSLKKVESVDNTLKALITSSESLAALSLGAGQLTRNLANIAGQSKELDTQSMQLSFKKAQDLALQAYIYANVANQNSFFKEKSQQLKDAAQKLAAVSTSAWELANLLPNMTGGQNRSYLLLLQNNTELRPGGGFIGNVGELQFEGGKLKKVTVEDVYAIDGQLKEKLEPPKELKEKLGVEQFYLRDSSWSPDFAQNAALARDFFKKETGKTVDGVIAFDLTFIEELLKATGPIKLPDYDEEISAENLFERGEYYSEIGFFPGSTQKKDFFGALSRALIDRLISSLSNSKQGDFSYFQLIEALQEAISQKHLMFTFDDQVLSSFVDTKGYNHPLPPATYNPADDLTQARDFLAISEANIGANKVNRFLERKISYDMTIGRDADLVARLTISYTNNSQADTWPGGKYVNYLRIYVPKASTLIEYQNGSSKDIKEVKGDNYGDVTVMSTYVEVPIKSTKTVTFTYRIPKNIKLETAPTYGLYIQKQPGTGPDALDFAFHLPNYLTATKLNGEDQNPPTQNLSVQTKLETDQKFEIQIKER